MSLFKKPSRKFKQRSITTDSDEENESFQQINKNQNKEETDDNSKYNEFNVEQPSSSNINLVNELKDEKASKTIKLSFEEDEDDKEAFQVKRSHSSIKALKQLEKKKKEVKKVTKKIDSSLQTKSIRKMMEINKPSLEEQQNLNQVSPIISDEIDIDCIEESDYETDSFQFRKPKYNYNSIPDTKTIEIIKRKRFLAKDSENDLISLVDLADTNENSEDEFLEGSDSRLIRDDPLDKETVYIDDDNDDLDDDRIDFCVDKTSIQKEKIKAAFLNAQNEEFLISNNSSIDDDSDNELDMWEKEQIRKGVSMQQFPQKLKNNENFSSMFINSNQKTNELPSYIRTMKPAFTKDKLLIKYKEELRLVNSKLEYLMNQFTNIDLTINNIRESLNNSKIEMINPE